MNFDNKILRVKDSLPLVPEGMENWILNKVFLPKALTVDGEKCWCGKCGNLFHSERNLEKRIKEHLENPCKCCGKKECSYSRLTEGKELPKTECYTYKEIREVDFITRCPVCQTKVRLAATEKNKFFRRVETCALTVHEGIQLLRSYVFDFTFTKGNPMNVEIKNICNHWISETGVVRVTRGICCDNEENKEPLLHLIISKGFHNYHRFVNNNDKDKKNPKIVNLQLEHFVTRTLYPHIQLAPYLKRTGFIKITEDQIKELVTWNGVMFKRTGSLLRFIKCLLRFPFVETLVKKGDFEMLYALMDYPLKEVKKIIPSYYIAIRKGLKPYNPKLWIDMVRIFDKAGKDIRNPFYNCREDLEKGREEAKELLSKKEEKERKKRNDEHERRRPKDIFWYLEKNPSEVSKCENDQEYFFNLVEIYGGFSVMPGYTYRFIWEFDNEREFLEIFCFKNTGEGYNENREIKEVAKKRFNKLKHNFINLEFGDEEFKISSLNTIEDYFEEGKAMHNCLDNSCYYLIPDSLILSVKKDGKRIADVELDLKTFEILQCLAPCNEQSPYKEKIEKLILSNLHLIIERINKKEVA